MKLELQKKLFEKYPDTFRQKDLPMNQTCMCWGIACGDGWYWLIDNLCGAIQTYLDNKNAGIKFGNKYRVPANPVKEEWRVEATQVKEKFGRLCFYVNSSDDELRGMINLAEHLSYRICEACGTTENVKVRDDGWISTLCDNCDQERKKK